MLTWKTREEVGKNASECRCMLVHQIDACWNIVKNCQKGKSHAPCTHINKLDKLETQGQLEFEHKFETTETGLFNLLHWYRTGTETKHGLTVATAESWCHHLPTYCVDRGLVDGAPRCDMLVDELSLALWSTVIDLTCHTFLYCHHLHTLPPLSVR